MENQENNKESPQPQSENPAPARPFDLRQLYAMAGAPVYNTVHQATMERVQDQQVWLRLDAPAPLCETSATVNVTEWRGSPPQAGQQIPVYVGDPPRQDANDSQPQLQLSVWRAQDLTNLRTVEEAGKQKSFVPGRVVASIKGGYSVELMASDEHEIGIRAFLPGSCIGLHAGEVLAPEAEEQFLVKTCNIRTGSIIVSLREGLRAKRQQRKKECLAQLSAGEVVEGTVRKVMPWGAFVDVGGAQGLLHIGDLVWHRRPRKEDFPREGQKLRVRVMEVDVAKEKIRLSRKDLMPDPWRDADQRYRTGMQVTGNIAALTDFGAFVQLQDGIEGLLHKSELSWQPAKNALQCVSVGQEIQMRVLTIDTAARRLALSMRALEKSPVERVADGAAKDGGLTGQIVRIENFGLFVRLDEHTDGLVHISELSWTKRVKHPSELFREGQQVRVAVLDCDVKRQRLSCSIKRTTPDPWPAWKKKYASGTQHRVKVSQLTARGALCTLEEELTGFCSTKELSSEPIDRPQDVVKVGQELDVVVTSCEPARCSVTLSVRQRATQETRQDYQSYLKRQAKEGSDRVKLGDALRLTATVRTTDG
ncbi:MAG: S1 RNA-binding domain-containing protein [Myxococcota bacterium]